VLLGYLFWFEFVLVLVMMHGDVSGWPLVAVCVSAVTVVNVLLFLLAGVE